MARSASGGVCLCWDSGFANTTGCLWAMGRQGVGPAMVSNHCRGGILGEDHHLVRSHGVRGRGDGEREPIAACGRSAAVPRWKLVMEIVRLQELSSGDTRS
ncbi:hypothetical protein TIFTF001_052729 [Ficus carica]|uniref:Uncharacterized protein n=1 Tax=Ficus carica TaxID=3494 RepID=A0AA88JGX4_FICCA|nr:hypothetical protein TIFTF001_052727 [Ficus carica]GMN71746.1 hypothetical protein TIFTF001_052729 [Ficus carica]